MPKVVGIRLRYAAKNYWFDPGNIELHLGDYVIVESVRGRDIALVAEEIHEVSEKDLKAPLKRVLRIADKRDFERAKSLRERSESAMPKFKELVQKNNLDMKPVCVDYAFSGDYATFYFSADDRVDFRQLVRDLASVFHVRIDMRQVGVRDESRMLGGLGHCGEELCCARISSETQPVSIRMAKEQDLPLNPTKISGQCGRLMCCLRYEFEAYKDFKDRAPKRNALVETPLGLAKVVDYDTPREIVNLKLEDGQSLSVPLKEMRFEKKKKVKEGKPVCKVSQESLDRVLQELNSSHVLSLMADKQFSNDDKLADQVLDEPKISRAPRKRKAASPASTSGRGKRSSASSGKSGKAKSASKGQERTLRKRRSVSLDAAPSNTEPASGKGAGAHKAEGKGGAAANGQAGNGSASNESAGNRAKKHGNKPRNRRNNNHNASSGSGNNNYKSRAGNSRPASAKNARPRPGQHSSSLSKG